MSENENLPAVTPIEVAAMRKLVGLTNDGLGAVLKVNPRTVRSWESGRDRPSEAAAAALTAVVERHDAEVDELLAAVSRDETVVLPRGPMPTGWYVALAARVLDAEPGARLVWEDDDFDDSDA